MPPARIVVLGGGFAGAYAVQALEKRIRPERAEITLLDRNNYFIFYPLLIEAGTGNLEPRHAVVPVRAFLKRSRFLLTSVEGLDPDRRLVRHRSPTGEAEELEYDHLVVALGSVTRLPPVPGLRDHGFEIKSLNQAVALRDRAIRYLEMAERETDPGERRRLLHFTVVGANFTGAELAGEFDVFLKEAGRNYRNVAPGDCKVTLVELAPRILGALEPDLSEYATRKLRGRGIDVLLETSIERIEPDHAVLSTGAVLATRTVIWCAGIAPSPALVDFPLPKDSLGYLLCDPDLRVRGSETLWGIGDAAVNPGPGGKPYPATAQNAVRQGRALARNLARVLDGKPTEPFVYRQMGAIAALGCRTGVAKVFGVKLSGFPAWFLFRTVYLLKMPGWGRRARVAVDWTLDLLFGRDHVALGVHREDRRE